MKVALKLKIYIREEGREVQWVAKKLGISPNYLSQVLRETHPLPIQCWQKVIHLTQGMVTLSDLMADKFKPIEYLQVMESEDPYICEIRIKEKT